MTVYIIEVKIMQRIEQKGLPVEMMEMLDIGYSFEKNVLEVFEIRPGWMDPDRIAHTPIIRAKYVRSKDIWKINRMRGNLKWTLYEPYTECPNLEEVF